MALVRRLGVRRVVLQVLRPGDVLGDIPYLCRMASPFTARALSDVVLIALDGAVLARLLGSRLACASGSSSA